MERTITETDTRVWARQIIWEPQIKNPVQVRAKDGELLGTAVLEFVNGGIKVEFFLDPHHPEVLDLEVNNKFPLITGQLTDEGYFITEITI